MATVTTISTNGQYGGDLADLQTMAANLTLVQVGTSWAVTNYTAHATGAVAVVSNAATDLDTTATALALLEDEVAALKVILIAAGIVS